MNTEKLKNIGLQELSVEEMRKTEGGILWFIVGIVVGVALGSVIYEAVEGSK
ncbi:MAG: hypothetical protein Q4C98_10600 [Capnocytophaga sp.]|nr:hypothetical protein [Capnocytophaga sp.]